MCFCHVLNVAGQYSLDGVQFTYLRVCVLQALQQDMAQQGLEVDAVTQLFAIEAAMEAWAKAGRPAAALDRADQLLQESNVMQVYPIFRSDDDR